MYLNACTQQPVNFIARFAPNFVNSFNEENNFNEE